MSILEMSPQPSIVVVVEHKKVYQKGGDRAIKRLVPTQGVVVFLCIVLALLLKAQDFEGIMESLTIATEVVRPLLAPVVLAVCGLLLLDMT